MNLLMLSKKHRQTCKVFEFFKRQFGQKRQDLNFDIITHTSSMMGSSLQERIKKQTCKTISLYPKNCCAIIPIIIVIIIPNINQNLDYYFNYSFMRHDDM